MQATGHFATMFEGQVVSKEIELERAWGPRGCIWLP